MTRRTIAAILLLTTSVGCGAKSPDSTPSASPSPTPAPVQVPDDWGRYGNEAVGVRFRFPAMDGTVYERLGGSSEGHGPVLTFEVSGVGRDSEGSPAPIALTFAGSTSLSARAGRECVPTDAYSWREHGDELLIDFAAPGNNCDHTVPSFTSVTRPDGLEGVIFSADHFARRAAPPDVEIEPTDNLTAMLRYPDGFHPDFETLVFQLDERFIGTVTLDDAELVLRSVTFTEPE